MGGIFVVAHRRIAQLTAKLLVHDIITEVGDVADHAGNAQATFGQDAVGIEMARMKIGVGDDGTARDLVERNVFCRQVGCTRHHHCMAHALWVLQRPAQGLHAPQRAAHHRRQGAYAQHIQQPGLRVDPVLHRDHREISTINPPGIGVDVHWAG